MTLSSANNLARRLAEAGIPEEIAGYARNRRFRYRPYISLFSDG